MRSVSDLIEPIPSSEDHRLVSTPSVTSQTDPRDSIRVDSVNRAVTAMHDAFVMCDRWLGQSRNVPLARHEGGRDARAVGA